MTTYTVLDHGNERTFPNLSHDKADERASGIKMMIDDPSEVEIVEGVYEEYSDYESDDDGTQELNPEVVDHAPESEDIRSDTPVEPDTNDSADVILRENPIDYLRGINPEFVNTIKGTPAISKRGFRFIQVHLGVSTTSEVVATFEEPRGVIIHARAELPDGRYAEAHGEGYAKGDVDSHEFARYADTRAKNRALSDLTSSGALAESELE